MFINSGVVTYHAEEIRGGLSKRGVVVVDYDVDARAIERIPRSCCVCKFV